jgi:SP family general alpha glucoside:H+ symporter-like MFS transporter
MSDEKVNEKVAAGAEGARHHDVLHDEVLANQDLFNDAIEAENAEHAMDMWSAAKKHPVACLWAFLMCFTIVSGSLIVIYFVPIQSQMFDRIFGGSGR